MEKECAYPNLYKQRGCTVLWKLQRNKANEATIKIWERIIEARLRDRVEISKQQYGFMPGKGTTDAMLALRMLMKKYREGQRELHCAFGDLEKAYDRVPWEELWYCMRKSGIVEKYVQLVQDMYEGNSGEVCSRNYRKFQGQGWTAPGISVKSIPVCSNNEQTNG